MIQPLGRISRQPSVDVDRPRSRRRPRNRSDCRARTRTRMTTRTNCGAAAPFSQRSLRKSVGAYGAYIAKGFAMMVRRHFPSGARACHWRSCRPRSGQQTARPAQIELLAHHARGEPPARRRDAPRAAAKRPSPQDGQALPFGLFDDHAMTGQHQLSPMFGRDQVILPLRGPGGLGTSLPAASVCAIAP